jgi:hypothetical protein
MPRDAPDAETRRAFLATRGRVSEERYAGLAPDGG